MNAPRGRRVAHDDDVTFEAHRHDLLGLAYRMLGDLQRSEDVVQDAWLRWSGRTAAVDNPRAYLLTAVARLCLNQLSSASTRLEVARSDRLPEPVDLSADPLQRLVLLDDLSLAFVVALQRLTAAERAALIMHDVFDMPHEEIAGLVGKTAAASRQLVHRARAQVRANRRSYPVPDREHRRLLAAFVEAARTGNVEGLVAILTEDVVLIADAGPEGGTFGGTRNLPGPLTGRRRVAAFAAAVTPRGAPGLEVEERRLNDQPALLILRDGSPFAVLALAVRDARISAIFIQSDPARLRRLGPTPLPT